MARWYQTWVVLPLLAFATPGTSALQNAQKANLVVIMSDDQDARLGSLEAQPYVKNTLMAEGLSLTNHFATVAQCCPSRTSYFRGQAAHNTNLTHVVAPGGGWEKFVQSGIESNYLPHWLKAAGYRTEYMGKIMNGYNLATYNSPKPSGWDYADLLLNPYTYEGNNVVMSQNGERPIFYNGYHQSDVLRAKALSRLSELAQADQPFYLQIAPTAPHAGRDGPPVPCARHMWSFNDAKAPRIPNFNPPDEIQLQKPHWLKELPLLNASQVDFVDWSYRSRLQALRGVDEIVEDVVEYLRSVDKLQNTYVIYTTDNGFHAGNHRQIGGKGLPYAEDTNIPMIIRGPGVPAGAKSSVPSTHVDMAPTYLEIAGLDKTSASYPPFLDGRSLLQEWTSSCGSDKNTKNKEILNVEFWGTISNGGGPDFEITSPVYAYKTLRIVSEKSAWLFSRWCSGNATELYNTIDDPYEITNLAINPTVENQRLISRLNGLLLVTKSCNQESCRNPWQVLQKDANAEFANLEDAMDAKYDHFFESLPSVGFQACMMYQSTANEGPYYPPESIALGAQYRNKTDNYVSHNANFTITPGNTGRMGTAAQRHVTLDTIMKSARNLTDAEIGTPVNCLPPNYCPSKGD
ncbi:arylsulfatase [Thozetella sp. PMI_491]|nr:arylsulfatase [Thozetella sp. PMI_491]